MSGPDVAARQLGSMHEWKPRKIRSEETWDEVRRAWEQGETGASLALRYDVGLANLWRRRAAEGWRRLRPGDPEPEPVEGWDRRAREALEAFRTRRDETRLLAEKLAEVMAGGPLDQTPLWHVGYVLDRRARRLGAEAAARDRDYMRRHAWADEFWDVEGRLKPVARLDDITLRANRDAWREDEGVPPGKAADIP